MSDLKEELAGLRIERAPIRLERRRWVTWIVLLVLAIGAGIGAWMWTTRPRAIEVEVASVTERAAGTQASVLNASGYVTARRRATISSKVTGKLVEVNVEEGTAVRQGQVLARLDDAEVRAALGLAVSQVEAARRAVRENEVRLHEAQLTETRRLGLFKDGIVTQAEVDQAEAEVGSYEARVDAAHQQVEVSERQVAVRQAELDNMVIRAPFSGDRKSVV